MSRKHPRTVSAPHRAPSDSSAASVELLLRFARAGHDAGYTTAELEDRLAVLARRLDLPEPEILATPTEVEIAIGALEEQRTFALRVRPAAVDLGAIALLDELVQDVLARETDPPTALARLTEVEATSRRRPRAVSFLAYAAIGASLTPMLGGGWREALAAAAVGVAVAAVVVPTRRLREASPVTAPLAGIVAAFTAEAIAAIGAPISPDLVTIAALVSFLPGMTLTVGVRELAAEQLQSGVANTANALVQLLGLVFGVDIGRSIALSWFGGSSVPAPHAGPLLVQVGAALVAGLAFTVRLRALSRDASLMCAACVLAVAANVVAGDLFGSDAGVFAAALTVGLVGGIVGRSLHRSPLVFIVPGVYMLVPGSTGLTSALQLLSDHAVSGVTAAFDTFVTAISIAYGLIISAALVPSGFTRRDATPPRGKP